MGTTIPHPIKLTKRAGAEYADPIATSDPALMVNYEEIIIVGVERLWNPSLHEPDTIVLQYFCICDGVLRFLLQAWFEPEWVRYVAQPWQAGGGSPG